MKEYPVILMPTHRTYADFILLSYAFLHYDLPLPVIAAAMGELHWLGGLHWWVCYTGWVGLLHWLGELHWLDELHPLGYTG